MSRTCDYSTLRSITLKRLTSLCEVSLSRLGKKVWLSISAYFISLLFVLFSSFLVLEIRLKRLPPQQMLHSPEQQLARYVNNWAVGSLLRRNVLSSYYFWDPTFYLIIIKRTKWKVKCKISWVLGERDQISNSYLFEILLGFFVPSLLVFFRSCFFLILSCFVLCNNDTLCWKNMSLFPLDVNNVKKKARKWVLKVPLSPWKGDGA